MNKDGIYYVEPGKNPFHEVEQRLFLERTAKASPRDMREHVRDLQKACNRELEKKREAEEKLLLIKSIIDRLGIDIFDKYNRITQVIYDDVSG